jgi:hypothetical protein
LKRRFIKVWSIACLSILSLCTSPVKCAYAGIRGPQKFQKFLPFLSQHTLISINNEVCNATLGRYVLAWKEASLDGLDSACTAHQKCILNEMSELSKSYMGSSSLVLGFVPVLFSTLGPSISEVALLSAKRPVLAAILSLGAVRVQQTRVFQYDDDAVAGILQQSTVLPGVIARWLLKRRYRCIGTSVLQYLLASLAVANVFWASWDLGLASGSNFICQSSYMPVIWTSVPGLVSLPATVALNVKVAKHSKDKSPSLGFITSEWQLCLTQSRISESAVETDAWMVCWHWVSTALGFVHVLLGILIYSSLMFTMTTDAVIVVVRYLASVAVCRLILIFELAGMRSTCRQQSKIGGDDDVALRPLVSGRR